MKSLPTHLQKQLAQLKIMEWEKDQFEKEKRYYREYSQQLKRVRNIKELSHLLQEMISWRLIPNKFIFSQLIQKLDRWGYIEYAYEIYLIAVEKLQTDAFVYNNMIQAAGKKGRIPLARAAYQAAIQAGYADTITYNNMIDAAGKNGDMGLARSAYQAAIQTGYVDTITYNNMIDTAGKNGDMGLARSAYQAAIQTGYANVITYTSMIGAAGKNGAIDLARSAYQAAIQTGYADVITYNSMINAAGKNGDMKLARSAYQAAIQTGYVNVITYNSMIDAAGKNGAMGLARAAYQAAIQAGYADVITYTSMIDAAGKNGAMGLAKVAYRAAIQTRCVNVITYNSMIDAAGKNGDMELARAAYQAAIQAGYADVITYTNMIDAAGKNGDMELAKTVYQAAIETGYADIITYNSMIDAAGKNGSIELAKAAYQAAIETGYADIITYNSMIDAAGKNGAIDLAKAAYQAALKTGHVDVCTYTSMINAAGKNGDVDLARAAYQAALKTDDVDVCTYTSMIDAAERNHALEIAEAVYDEAIHNNMADTITHDIALKIFTEAHQLKKNKELTERAAKEFKSKPAVNPPKTPYPVIEKSRTIPVFENLGKTEKIIAALNAVGLKPSVINYLLTLSKKGIHFTGTVATFAGLLCYNTAENASKIPLNDIDGIMLNENPRDLAQPLMDEEHFQIETQCSEYIKLTKLVEEIPVDLTLGDEKTYQGGELITGFISGQLYLLTPQDLLSTASKRRFDVVNIGNDLYFGIDKTHKHYPHFKWACQTLEYRLVPYNRKTHKKYFMIALKTYEKLARIKEHPYLKMDSPLKCPADKKMTLINYPKLLATLEQHFFNEISSKELGRQKICYLEIYALLKYAGFYNLNAQPYLRALIKAVILTENQITPSKSPPAFKKWREPITDEVIARLGEIYQMISFPSSALVMRMHLEGTLKIIISSYVSPPSILPSYHTTVLAFFSSHSTRLPRYITDIIIDYTKEDDASITDFGKHSKASCY